jgi:hypothetical protein
VAAVFDKGLHKLFDTFLKNQRGANLNARPMLNLGTFNKLCQCFGLVPPDVSKLLFRQVAGRDMGEAQLKEALFHVALMVLSRESGSHIPDVVARDDAPQPLADLYRCLLEAMGLHSKRALADRLHKFLVQREVEPSVYAEVADFASAHVNLPALNTMVLEGADVGSDQAGERADGGELKATLPPVGAQHPPAAEGADPASPRSFAEPASPRSLADPASPRSLADPASPRSLADPASPRSLADPASPRSIGTLGATENGDEAQWAEALAKAQKNLRKEGDGELAAAEAAARAEFAKIDVNNDGVISPEEFVAYKSGSAVPAAEGSAASAAARERPAAVRPFQREMNHVVRDMAPRTQR